MTNIQLFALAKVLGLTVSEEIIEKGYNTMDLIKQKLLDIYYNAEDGHKVHGILPCQSRTKCCTNLASTLCSNHMCKMCCQVYILG